MNNAPRGYIALLAVLVIFVFSLSLATAVAYFSIDEAQSAFALAEGEAAAVLADGCAEDALLQAGRNPDYAGGTGAFLQGTCSVEVAKDGVAWTLDVSGARLGYGHRLHIEIEMTVPPVLKSWQET